MAREAPKYLETYATVAERLAAFWLEHPKGSVQTGQAEYPDDKIVRVRSIVYRWDEEAKKHVPLASGQAEEVREGYINEAAATENCETSAVGRALALAGYGINKGIASVEEIELADRRRRARADADGAPPLEYPEPSEDAETSTPQPVSQSASDSESDSDIDELVKQIVEYVKLDNASADEQEVRKEFVKAKLMALGVENPTGVRESVVLLDQESKAALREWLAS